MNLKNLSLSRKALLGLTLVLLPIVISFVHSFTESRKHLMEQTLEDLTVIAEAYEGQVYQFLEMAKIRAEDLSTDGIVASGLKEIAAGRPGAGERLSQYFSRFKLPLESSTTRITAISSGGEKVASTDQARIGQVVKGMPYFEHARQAVVIEEVFERRDVPDLVAAAPVFDPATGEFLGEVAVFQDLSNLSRVLTGELNRDLGALSWSKGKRKTMEAYLVNRDRLMLTESLFVKGAVFKQEVATFPVAECLDGGVEVSGYYPDYRGVEVAGASMCLPSLKWVLLVEVDREEILAPIRAIARDAALGALASVAVIVLLFGFFYRQVLMRLAVLSGASANIADGNYEIEVPAGSKDEIGVLSRSFNRMSAEVRGRTGQLRQSEEKYRTLIARIPDVTWTADRGGRLTFVSPNAAGLLGFSPEEILAEEGRWWSTVHPDDLDRVRSAYEALYSGGAPFEQEYRLKARGGRWVWVSDRAHAVYEKDGVMYADGLLTDITGRKAAERKSARLKALYSALSRINEAIARTREIGKIYDEACAILVEEGGFVAAWIGMTDETSALVVPVARGGSIGTYPEEAGISVLDEPSGRGPTGTAIRENRAVVSESIESDQLMEPWREAAVSRGFRSSAALPLRAGQKAVGAMNLYAAEPEFFGQEEVILLEALAADLSFAIESLEFERQGRLKGEEVMFLQSISLSVKDAEDFRSALRAALRKVCEFTGWDFGEVWVPRSDGLAIEYASIWYGSKEVYARFAELSRLMAFPPGIGVPGTAWASSKSVWVRDTSSSVEFARGVLSTQFGLKGAFGTPVVAEGRVMAVLVFLMADSGDEDRRLTEIVSSAVSQLGPVIQRKQSEEARQAMQQRYEELLNNITVGVYRDTEMEDGRFVEVNSALVHMLEGPSREDVLERKVAGFFADRARRSEINRKISKYGYVRNEEAELVTMAGNRIWVSISAVKKTGCCIGKVCFDGMFEDITERKRLEEQLRHSQKLEAVGQLAGGVAHDFNNLLTAIIGYGNLLLMKRGDDTVVRGYAEHMLSLSDKASTLTQSLLAFSRKQMMNPQPIEINEIIRRVEKILARLIGEDVRLETTLSPEEITVRADSAQMEQVLMNLATNARDAMPGGGILAIGTGTAVLTPEFVASHGYGEPGEYALVTVSDTGQGMDEETRKRIFEPFFTTKDVGKGTGLGLSVVYGIVKQHGGYINVYSEPGDGSVFRLYLPRTEAGERSVQPRAVEAIRGGTETILLAEDEPEVRDVNRSILEEFGYTVIEAADGQEAVEKFAANMDEVSLVILDIVMPRKSGKEAYDEMVRMKPGAKVLFTSGYAAELMRARGVIGAGVEFISKPASPGEFLNKVREAIDK